MTQTSSTSFLFLLMKHFLLGSMFSTKKYGHRDNTAIIDLVYICADVPIANEILEFECNFQWYTLYM